MSPELQARLDAQQMRGERIVNHVRALFAVAALLALAAAGDEHTPEATAIYAAQRGAWLIYAIGLYGWFALQRDRRLPWLPYLSVTVDLALLAVSVFAMHRDHAGVIAWFRGLVPLGFVFWTLLAGLRGSRALCFYAAALAAVLYGGTLAHAVATGLVPVSEVSVYGRVAINVEDQLLRVALVAIPGLLVGFQAGSARALVVLSAEEERRRADHQRERDHLRKYLPRELVELVQSGRGTLALGGVRREATVLFVDIRGFTPLAEAREPEEVVAILNDYLSEMVPIVFRHGGLLDKFLGDGFMAVFGAPFDQPADAQRAVLAAIEVERALGRVGDRLRRRGVPPLSVGIGVARGPVVVGNVGTDERMEYTCVGDTVNFAARLQALSRDLGATIVLSPAAHAALDGAVPSRRLPPVRVRGRRDEVALWVVDEAHVDDGVVEALRTAVLRAEAEGDQPPRVK